MKNGILARLGVLLLLTVFFVWLQMLVEATPWGRWLAGSTSDWLQSRLARASRDLNVAVINIDDIPRDDTNVYGDVIEGLSTNRAMLKSAVEAVAKCHPKSIAIDIDFTAPLDPHVKFPYIHPEDRRFVSEISAICKHYHVKLVLGSHRRSLEPLGVKFPRATEDIFGDISKPEGEPGLLNLQARRGELVIPSLALKVVGQPPKEPALSPFLTTVVRRQVGPDLEVELFPADLSYLDILPMHTFAYVPGEDLRVVEERLRGKHVLLGNADEEKTSDIHPAYGNKTAVGVYFHACAIETLLSGGLIVVSDYGDFLFDVLVALIVFFLVELGRRVHRYDPGQEHAVVRRLHFMAAAGVIVLGLSINVTGVVWLSVYVVALALALQPFLEGPLLAAPGRARAIIMWLLAPKPEPETEK